MKQNEATIFIFIASIIIGILISSNMNLSKFNNKVLLNLAEYQKAYDYNIKLNRDIRSLKEEHREYNKKLKKYKENVNNKGTLQLEMEEEIKTNEMILGSADVEGEGVEITLDDASSESQGGIVSPEDWNFLIVHAEDIMKVINDLKFAGGEAISVNGQRIIRRTNIFCWGAFPEIDKIKVPPPFDIKVIGDKEKLFNYLEGNESMVSILKMRGISVHIVKKDNINILGINKKLDYNYVKESKGYNKQ